MKTETSEKNEKIILSSKAQNLFALKDRVKQSVILPLFCFKVSDFFKNENAVADKVVSMFCKTDVIVRSSAMSEDCAESSCAGVFRSVLNVSPDKESIISAVREVIDSYDNSGENEVFIQPMLTGTEYCGVAFTEDPETGVGYYIINYSADGYTDTVTAGKNNTETCIVFKEAKDMCADNFIKKVIGSCEEIMYLTGEQRLDIEFAYAEETVYIFQVRKITTVPDAAFSTLNLSDSLNKIHKKIKKLNSRHPGLLGDKTILGVMPDWNPAEIIGLRPKMLSLSLYMELVTDSIWAYQRDNYGYRNLRSHPLMVSFLGIPYIDARVSFNSFIPKNLDDRTAEKLAGYYLRKLEDNKFLHDKVEFEIVFSCWYPGIQKKLETLCNCGFTKDETAGIRNSLLELTNRIMKEDGGLFRSDMSRIETLNEKYKEICESELPIVGKIYWHLEYCKRYGTLPFAGIARAAFIGVQFLNSFEECGLISSHEKAMFLSSLNTVSRQINSDLHNLDKNVFLEKYGHLRPGTYDILSKRYDESFETYFGVADNEVPDKENNFDFSSEFYSVLDQLLDSEGFVCKGRELVRFIKDAIEGREYSKLIFSRSVSMVLKLIGEFGARVGLEPEYLAFLNINTIKRMYSSINHQDVKDIFMEDIRTNRAAYDYTLSIKLPALITRENDIYSFMIAQENPNFVTLGRVQADVVADWEINSSALQGKIVCLPSADPGYDFLFTCGISGLVTCFGGANSHMAIRCHELGIPAAIGCGSRIYKKCVSAKKLELDAGNRTLKVIA